MPRYCLLFLLCILIALSPKAQSIAGLDSLLEAMMKRRNEVGIAVAVVKKDSLIYTRGFGYRDLERHLPVTPETVFMVGSCTKSMTAALFGCLGDKVILDSPVHRYLPNLKFYSATMTEQVTIRDLLCHRSGLPRHEFSWLFMAAGSRDSMIRRIAFLEPNYRVAEKWQYNNWGYLVLGVIAEKLYGMPYETAIQRYLLQPLGMKRSFFSMDSLRADRNAALGYTTNNEARLVPYHPMEVMAPVGGLNSTAPDMARWISCWVNGMPLLPASFRTQAMSSQVVTKPALPMADQAGTFFSNFGFGWFLASYRGHYRVEHGGNIDGFTSNASFFPADSLGIVVLCNRDGSLLPVLVRNTIADYFFRLPIPERLAETKQNNNSNPKAPEKKAADQVKYTPLHPLSAYVGHYEHPGYGKVIITQRSDSLFAQIGIYNWLLCPQQDGTFQCLEFSGGKYPHIESVKFIFRFHLDATGTIESISIPFEPALAPLRFVKKQAISVKLRSTAG